MTIADTHALVWLWTGDASLGSSARQTLDDALQDGELTVSAMTFWEVATLRAKGRLDFPEDVGAWRRELLSQGLIEIPVDGDWTLRILSGISEGICNTLVQSGGEFLYIGVGGR